MVQWPDRFFPENAIISCDDSVAEFNRWPYFSAIAEITIKHNVCSHHGVRGELRCNGCEVSVTD